MLNKCEMAILGYCNKAKNGCCNAKDEELKECPYLDAIGEIALMYMKGMDKEIK